MLDSTRTSTPWTWDRPRVWCRKASGPSNYLPDYVSAKSKAKQT